MRKCNKCGEEKDESLFPKVYKCKQGDKFYYKKPRWCKSCFKEYNKKRHLANKKSGNEKSRKYYQENKERLKAVAKEWARNNKEKRREIALGYYKRNKKRAAENLKKWRRKNKEHFNKQAAKYAKSNPEKRRALDRRQRELLNDGWLRQEMIKKGWPKEAITEDLLSVKRSIIKLKRHVKNNQST